MTQGTRRLFIVLKAGMVALALGAGAVRPAPARAAGAITFDGSPGTGAPPPTLGPYTMQPFSADPRPSDTAVSGVTGPTGQVGFTPALLYVGGKGSNFPAADSYYTGNLWNLWNRSGGATSMTFTLPPGMAMVTNPAAMSHRWVWPLSSPVASVVPSGANATVRTPWLTGLARVAARVAVSGLDTVADFVVFPLAAGVEVCGPEDVAGLVASFERARARPLVPVGRGAARQCRR